MSTFYEDPELFNMILRQFNITLSMFKRAKLSELQFYIDQLKLKYPKYYRESYESIILDSKLDYQQRNDGLNKLN